MDLIAKKAGLTKGGLYHHFSSKEKILVAANDQFMEPVTAMIAQALDSTSPVAGLTAYIQAYVAHWAAHKRQLVFTFLSLAKSLQDPSLWPQMAEYTAQMQLFFCSMLQRAVECGELRPHDCESRATAMFAAMDGATSYAVMSPELAPDVIAERLIKVFLKELEEDR